MIADGRKIASDILAEVHAQIGDRKPVVRAITVRPEPATESYLRIKMQRAEEGGMHLEVVKLADEATEDDIIAAIQAPGADAVIVQLPIPQELNLEKILSAIPLEKDADVLSSAAYARFENGESGALVPPVASGVLEILARTGVDVRGKKTVVVGRGQLVGKPCAIVLARMGAEVSVVSRETENPEELYKTADIIVSGAGVTHLIQPDMVKEGVVLIDAGTSGASGAVAGDIDPACATKAAVFTPVPGGVGPVAVSCLFKNTAALLSA
jgi:methylenetetrahydrofolate dehydrogenase (NADP+)/methenyltetrahydrofolate cyclohydrolase